MRSSTPGSGRPTEPGTRVAVIGVGGVHVGFGHAVALEDGVAGARLPFAMGLGQQRRRAGDEQAHVRGRSRVEARVAAAGGCRRSARPSSRCRAAAAGRSRRGRTSAGRSSRRRASSVTLVATNRPWVWKIGSACSSTSFAVKRQSSSRARRWRRGCRGSASRPSSGRWCPRCRGSRRDRRGARYVREFARLRLGAHPAACRLPSVPSVSTAGRPASGDAADAFVPSGRADDTSAARRRR